MPLPDPALVVLVGASGSGKSTWAARHYRAAEVVSSDALRGVVGSGPHDLDASADAFAVLEAVVGARLARRLTTVVDTLGLEPERRRAWLARARECALPAVAVLLRTSDDECRLRNAGRDRPVPAPVLARQLRRVREVADELSAEGWDEVLVLDGVADQPTPTPAPTPKPAEPTTDRRASTGVEVVLQLSRFPWGEDPMAWLRSMALAASEAGFAGLALMDHLIQIPQAGRAWDPVPEPWVALGSVAGLGTGLRLGTLCTPVTFRPPGVTAKAAATLSALNGGGVFLGVGAGWWEREHAAFGIPFPSTRARLDGLDRGVRVVRALWAAGTKPFDDGVAALPETTCYPRPTEPVTVIVGGNGERRTLRIAAELGDACNLTTSDPETVRRKVEVLRRHCADVGRDPADVAVTVLDLPVVGADREDVWVRVERLRGRTSAAAFAARTNAGTVAHHRDRHAALAALGVGTVFLSTRDLDGPEAVAGLAGLND